MRREQPKRKPEKELEVFGADRKKKKSPELELLWGEETPLFEMLEKQGREEKRQGASGGEAAGRTDRGYPGFAAEALADRRPGEGGGAPQEKAHSGVSGSQYTLFWQ